MMNVDTAWLVSRTNFNHTTRVATVPYITPSWNVQNAAHAALLRL